MTTLPPIQPKGLQPNDRPANFSRPRKPVRTSSDPCDVIPINGSFRRNRVQRKSSWKKFTQSVSNLKADADCESGLPRIERPRRMGRSASEGETLDTKAKNDNSGRRLPPRGRAALPRITQSFRRLTAPNAPSLDAEKTPADMEVVIKKNNLRPSSSFRMPRRTTSDPDKFEVPENARSSAMKKFSASTSMRVISTNDKSSRNLMRSSSLKQSNSFRRLIPKRKGSFGSVDLSVKSSKSNDEKLFHDENPFHDDDNTASSTEESNDEDTEKMHVSSEKKLKKQFKKQVSEDNEVVNKGGRFWFSALALQLYAIFLLAIIFKKAAILKGISMVLMYHLAMVAVNWMKFLKDIKRVKKKKFKNPIQQMKFMGGKAYIEIQKIANGDTKRLALLGAIAGATKNMPSLQGQAAIMWREKNSELNKRFIDRDGQL